MIMACPEGAINRELYKELVDQGQHPPGADSSLGAFYQAVVERIDNRDPFARMINDAWHQRLSMTTKHMANLLFRGVQFVKFEAGTPRLLYPLYQHPEEWQGELSAIMSDENSQASLKESLTNRTTTTTIYQRYAGPYVITAHLFDGSPVLMADFGCGGNYGLRGVELHEPFKGIADFTPNRLVSSLLAQPINLDKGLAIDREDPDNPIVQKWRLACSFYPQELDQLPAIEAFEERIKGSRRVQFLKADLLTLDPDWLIHGAVDLVIISTMFYQLDPAEQRLVTDKAKGLLKTDGVLVVQDYAKKNPADQSTLDFSSSWFSEDFSYRTFIAKRVNNWQFQEALQWNNGRCNAVKPGEDFDPVFR